MCGRRLLQPGPGSNLFSNQFPLAYDTQSLRVFTQLIKVLDSYRAREKIGML